MVNFLPVEAGPDGFVQPAKLISATAVNAGGFFA
jgi:hypothetical protein